MADLLIRCQKRNLALPLELSGNLAVEDPLIRFNGQEEVDPLILWQRLRIPSTATSSRYQAGMRIPRRIRASGIALIKLMRSRSVAARAVSGTGRARFRRPQPILKAQAREHVKHFGSTLLQIPIQPGLQSRGDNGVGSLCNLRLHRTASAPAEMRDGSYLVGRKIWATTKVYSMSCWESKLNRLSPHEETAIASKSLMKRAPQ